MNPPPSSPSEPPQWAVDAAETIRSCEPQARWSGWHTPTSAAIITRHAPAKDAGEAELRTEKAANEILEREVVQLKEELKKKILGIPCDVNSVRWHDETEKWKGQYEAEHQLVLTCYDQLKALRSTQFAWVQCSGSGGRMPTREDGNAQGEILWHAGWAETNFTHRVIKLAQWNHIWSTTHTAYRLEPLAWSRIPAYAPLAPAASETEREVLDEVAYWDALAKMPYAYASSMEPIHFHQGWQAALLYARKAKEERT